MIFTRLKRISHDLGYDTYEYLPDISAAYPFVHIGEQFEQITVSNKDRVSGSTQIRLHVWHNNIYQRGTLSEMMHNLKREIWKLKEIDHLTIRVIDTDDEMIIDTSTDSQLLHGIITVEINFQ